MNQKNKILPFVMLGDPLYAKETILKLAEQSSGLEIGFPFSNAIADGPVVQRSHIRALKNEFTLEKGFSQLKEIKDLTNLPLHIMISVTVVEKIGSDKLFRKLFENGATSVLLPDVPFEESNKYKSIANLVGLNYTHLISPNTSRIILNEIVKDNKGFIYLTSVCGSTGIRTKVNENLDKTIKSIKELCDVQIYVGFGIKNKSDINKLAAKGVGSVIGSAILKTLEENKSIEELDFI